MARPINYKGAETEIFDSFAAESWPLGTRMYTVNGRVFRRARASAVALTVGKLVRKPEYTLGHADLTVAAAASIGDPNFTVTLTYESIGLDEYKDGVVYINDAGGQGHVYGVVSNTVHTVGSSNTLTINLNSSLKVALTTSSKITLIKNRYNGVRVTEFVPNERALGVVPVAVTASYYFWLQTGGPTAILQDGDWEDNRDLVPSNYVQGAAMSASAATLATEVLTGDIAFVSDRLVEGPAVSGAGVNNTIGYVLDARDDTDYGLAQLTLDDR